MLFHNVQGFAHAGVLTTISKPVKQRHFMATNGAPTELMFKNRLQEYAQKLGLPLPLYQTMNEGFTHAPLFRATVIVDGETYRSQHTFKHRKTAEQDVARLALESLSKKIEVEGTRMISEETILCKSILNEFVVKTNMEKPSYTVVQASGLLPMFVSSVVFNGVTYTGNAAKSKREAEQLAARKVIQTILERACNSSHKNILSKIIKSKSRPYDSTNKNTTSNENHKRVSVDSVTDPLPSHVVGLKKLKVENASEVTNPTNGGVRAPDQAAKLFMPQPALEGNNLQLLVVNARRSHGVAAMCVIIQRTGSRPDVFGRTYLGGLELASKLVC
ncbi:Double-stranded RNA-binding protein 4 [Nymphaea thermarum]|nr:Double-stranded RNA-binding protein 4 [Nymphaea thermarum]